MNAVEILLNSKIAVHETDPKSQYIGNGAVSD